MSVSDNQEIQLLYTWWKKYGSYLVFAILGFAVVSFGTRYWLQHRDSYSENASTVYTQMLEALEHQKQDEAEVFGKKLVEYYPKSAYAALGSLFLAKNSVVVGDLKAALESLQFVIKNSSDKTLQGLAKVRAARVLVALKEPKKALDLLSTKIDSGYELEINEIKGDAFLALGKAQEAEQAYSQAKIIEKALAVSSPTLNTKLRQF